MIMLASAGELGYARAIHEAIGRLLLPEDGQRAERGANVVYHPGEHQRSATSAMDNDLSLLPLRGCP
jgi:hypothetical protein